MIGAIFGQLGTKIFGGLSLFLLVAALVLYMLYSNERDEHEKTRLELKAMSVERDRLRDDAARMVQEGAERTERGRQALREQEPRSAETRRQIERIQADAPAVDCQTPKSVMDAGL